MQIYELTRCRKTGDAIKINGIVLVTKRWLILPETKVATEKSISDYWSGNNNRSGAVVLLVVAG